MEQKPVAWIRSGDDQLSLVKQKNDGYMIWQPLYTHPHSDKSVKAKSLTTELQALLDSVNGDYYLGKEKEEALVAQVRKQYSEPAKTLTDEEMLKCAEEAGCVFDYTYRGEVTFISKAAFKRFVVSILKKASEK